MNANTQSRYPSRDYYRRRCFDLLLVVKRLNATTTPDTRVSTESINARLMLNAFISLINPQDSEKCFLRNFYGTDLLHAPLAGFLFFQQFSLARNVATITFGSDIFS